MNKLQENLFPKVVRNIFVNTGLQSGVRQMSGYQYLYYPGDKFAKLRKISEMDFTPGDLISLGTLIGNAQFYKKKSELEYYKKAFQAVKEGLHIQDISYFFNILGIKQPKNQTQDLYADGYEVRMVGMVSFLHIRARLIEAQNIPGASEIDAPFFGEDVYKENTPEKEMIVKGINCYENLLDSFTRELIHIDTAICSLLEWDPQKKVSFDDLLNKYNFPNPEDYLNFDF
jgi:hypothetical protein